MFHVVHLKWNDLAFSISLPVRVAHLRCLLATLNISILNFIQTGVCVCVCVKLQQSKINFRRFINSRSSLRSFGNVRCWRLTPPHTHTVYAKSKVNVVRTRSSHLLSIVICAFPCNVALTIGCFTQSKSKLPIKDGDGAHHYPWRMRFTTIKSFLLIICYVHFGFFASFPRMASSTMANEKLT